MTSSQLEASFSSPKNFNLYVNEALCSAPGYEGSSGAPILSETFDTNQMPDGWAVIAYESNN